MHWFWKATIGIAAGCVLAGLSVTVFERSFDSYTTAIMQRIGGTRGSHSWQMAVSVGLGFFLPSLLLAFITYGVLTILWPARAGQGPGQTLCRNCGYILRGITEPRCPECGERI